MTLDKLDELRLDGMARALREQMEMPETYADMTFDERLGLLVDREDVDRTNRRLRLRLKRAKLRYSNAWRRGSRQVPVSQARSATARVPDRVQVDRRAPRSPTRLSLSATARRAPKVALRTTK